MNRVREFRQALEMSQAALGEAAGIHQVQVSFIEIGRIKKPRHKTMAAIAEALGCSIQEVFPDAPPPKATPAERAKELAAEVLGASERLTADNCDWCGRRDVRDQVAVLTVGGEKVFEAGHLRCMREFIIDNTDRQGNWKKHRITGLR